jgi:hypothetical protein
MEAFLSSLSHSIKHSNYKLLEMLRNSKGLQDTFERI